MQNAQPSVGGAALVMSLAVAFRAVLDDAGREAGAPALALATGAQYGWDYAAFRSRGRLDDEPKVIVVIAKATRRRGARVVQWKSLMPRACGSPFNRDFSEGEYKLVVNNGVRVTSESRSLRSRRRKRGRSSSSLAGFQANGWDVDGQWTTDATVTNDNIVLKTTPCDDTLAKIADAARHGMIYVNVHSVAKPGGVARGQLEED